MEALCVFDLLVIARFAKMTICVKLSMYSHTVLYRWNDCMYFSTKHTCDEIAGSAVVIVFCRWLLLSIFLVYLTVFPAHSNKDYTMKK